MITPVAPSVQDSCIAQPADDATRILETVEASARGPFANLFYFAARAGAPPYGHASTEAWTPELLRLTVMDELTRRLRQAFRYDNDSQYEKVKRWIALCNAEEAATRDFCAYVLWRESLPPEERERLKAERGEEHRRAYLDQQPPTSAQLSYLRRLSYIGEKPRSKQHASQLIESMLKCRGYKGGGAVQ